MTEQVWGDHVLETPPGTMDKMNARQMLVTIEQGLASFLNDPNFESSEEDIRKTVDAYLAGIAKAKGIYDGRCGDIHKRPITWEMLYPDEEIRKAVQEAIESGRVEAYYADELPKHAEDEDLPYAHRIDHFIEGEDEHGPYSDYVDPEDYDDTEYGIGLDPGQTWRTVESWELQKPFDQYIADITIQPISPIEMIPLRVTLTPTGTTFMTELLHG